MRWIGHILLWIGFLSGAMASVFQLEIPDNKWQTVNWLWYGASILVGVAGIYLLRSTAKQKTLASAVSETELSGLKNQMDAIVLAMKELVQSKDKMAPHEIVHFIDERFVVPFAEFADGRLTLANRFGLQFYADVMTQFASGERYVNRAWSAAADGYVDEVSDSLRRAEEHLARAHQLVFEAK